MSNDTKGSNWRKWDLHVHTPESIVHDYKVQGGDKEKLWEQFFENLRKLDSSFSVIGINDYIFLEGYRKVDEEHAKGNLPNLDLILPVIELRIDSFGGANKGMGRINYHVLFSNKVSADKIQSQFLNGLTRDYELSPSYQGKVTWDAIITRESLGDLGEMIRETSPSSKANILPKSNVEIGFNNFNCKLDNIKRLLESHYFKNKFLTGIGKTEWGQLRWDQHTADKKNIINGVDFIFSASPSIDAYETAKENFNKDEVNSTLLHCSDAHSFAESESKPKQIGHCFTWIKADTTFKGLQQALKEFEERVHIGDEPDKMKSVKIHPTKYIKSIEFQKKSKQFDEIWFDKISIDFNHGLVAIIGNKGSAKSALTDAIGLLCDTRNNKDFSFLNNKKFRQRGEDKSKFFNATLTLESNQSFTKSLNDEIEETEIERVKYIPQNYFEIICNEIDKNKSEKFDGELEEVIFSHVTESNRLEKKSLKDLINYKTDEINDSIEQFTTELKKLNLEIVEKEKKISEDYKKRIENKLKIKEEELKNHVKTKPQEVKAPSAKDKKSSSQITKIEELKTKKTNAETDIKKLKTELGEITLQQSQLEKAYGQINLFETQKDSAEKNFNKLKIQNINFNNLVEIKVDLSLLDSLKSKLVSRKQEIENQFNEDQDKSLTNNLQKIKEEIKKEQKNLNKPNKIYESYLRELETWESKTEEIKNGKANDSIKMLNNSLKEIKNIPSDLKKLNTQRNELSRKIYKQIEKRIKIYKELYKPVQKFINEHELANEFSLSFDVSILAQKFKDEFFDWINKSNAGTFCGAVPGKQALEDLLEKFDFNDGDQTIKFIDEISLAYLRIGELKKILP